MSDRHRGDLFSTRGFLRTHEAAHHIGVNRATLLSYRRRGLIQAYQRPIDTRGDLYYKTDELEALMVFEPVDDQYLEELSNRFVNPDTGDRYADE